jgi:hypothetical protein
MNPRGHAPWIKPYAAIAAEPTASARTNELDRCLSIRQNRVTTMHKKPKSIRRSSCGGAAGTLPCVTVEATIASIWVEAIGGDMCGS